MINPLWLRNVPEDKHESYEQAIRASTIIVRRLKEILRDWEDDLDRADVKINDYDTPSWSFKQAHRNGDRSRIRKLRDLLTF